MFEKIKDHPVLVVLSMVVGAFIAGASSLVFMQAQIEKGVNAQIERIKPELFKSVTAQIETAKPDFVKSLIDQTGGKPLSGTTVTYEGDAENGCIQAGDWQLCWGRSKRSPQPNSSANTSILSETFTFKKPFKSIPVVTTGINGETLGFAWVVYNSSVQLDTFSLNAIDIQRRPSSEVVTMNYIATGRWR